MASYKLIRDGGDEVTLDLRSKNCALRIDGGGHGGGGGDVETAYLKSNTPSPRLRQSNFGGGNASSKCTLPSGRLVSLDVFRGLTVVLMIIVDDAGGFIPSINHSPWNGLTLADFVMPFFLFMVGVSLGLVYKNMVCRVAATKKAIFRAGKLLILGIFLQGGYFHSLNNLTYGVDLEQIRWMGILQRIAIAYWFAAMCEIWLRNDEKVDSRLSLLKKYKWQWAMALMLTAVYLLMLYALYVPDWEYHIPAGASSGAEVFRLKCGVRGDTGPACNAAGMIDRAVLGIQRLYRKPIYARTEQCSINSPDYGPLPPDAPSWCRAPFDPEGILSTVMAIVTCLLGLQYGHVIVHYKDHKKRLSLWSYPSTGFMLLGLLCHILGMHINKALYSVSYTCVTAGVAGILLATIYLVVDVHGWRRFTALLEWMGMHALLIYILVACNILPLILQGFYWKHPHNNILTLIGIGKRN
ncbi:heparan-alpha-glucosaminide N-acetyltransferase-like protein [Perilla frutescens var. frutescens]|nr:heparan-alpha-glucosaminide N-acetyltransferase-like protein [Perilla frutescens var. frutescens]